MDFVHFSDIITQIINFARNYIKEKKEIEKMPVVGGTGWVNNYYDEDRGY